MHVHSVNIIKTLTTGLVIGVIVSTISINNKVYVANSNEIVKLVSRNNISTKEDIAYPYIGYLVDSYKKELSGNKYGKNYRSILDNYFHHTGTWTQYNDSNDIKIDTSIVFEAVTDDGQLFTMKFRFYQPNTKEYSIGYITPYLNDNVAKGEELLKKII